MKRKSKKAKPRRPKVGRLKSKRRSKKPKARRPAPRRTKRRTKIIGRPKQKNVGGRGYYGLNPKFQFLGELRNLVLTSPPASFNNMASKIGSLGRVKLALASGVFLNKENVADLLIVGDDIDRRKFKTFLKSLEAEVGTQVLYAIMDREEFTYRRAMFDRFVRLMLEGPHEVLIDRIGL